MSFLSCLILTHMSLNHFFVYVQLGSIKKIHLHVWEGRRTAGFLSVMQEMSFLHQVSERSAYAYHTLVCYRLRGERRGVAPTLYCYSSPVSCGDARRPSWMNEWVGPDINVVGPLEMPPNDEFSISESNHFFGETFETNANKSAIQVYSTVNIMSSRSLNERFRLFNMNFRNIRNQNLSLGLGFKKSNALMTKVQGFDLKIIIFVDLCW